MNKKKQFLLSMTLLIVINAHCLGLEKGDGIFRSQSIPFAGHAALYWEFMEYPPVDSWDQKIIEMPGTGQGLVLTNNLQTWTSSGKTFWGSKTLPWLTAPDRIKLVSEAMRFTNAVYYIDERYKNPSADPPTFRCDGLVEYCYEFVLGETGPEGDNGGIIANDTAVTLSPNAMFNATRWETSELPGGPQITLRNSQNDTISPLGGEINFSDSIKLYCDDTNFGSGLGILEIWRGNPDSGGYKIKTDNTDYLVSSTYSYPCSALGCGDTYIRSYDQAGNYSTSWFKIIDTTPPSLIFTDTSNSQGAAGVFTLNDNGSGVVGLTLTPASGTPRTFTYNKEISVSQSVSLARNTSYTASAVDAVGNTSETAFVTGSGPNAGDGGMPISFETVELDIDSNNQPHYFVWGGEYFTFRVDPVSNYEGYLRVAQDVNTGINQLAYTGPVKNSTSISIVTDEFGPFWSPDTASLSFDSEGNPGVLYIGISRDEEGFEYRVEKFAKYNDSSWSIFPIKMNSGMDQGTNGGEIHLAYSAVDECFVGLYTWQTKFGSWNYGPEEVHIVKIRNNGEIINDSLIEALPYQPEGEGYKRVNNLQVTVGRDGRVYGAYTVDDYVEFEDKAKFFCEQSIFYTVVDVDTYSPPQIAIDGNDNAHIAYCDYYGLKMKKVVGAAVGDDDFFALTDLAYGKGIDGFQPLLKADRVITSGSAGYLHLCFYDNLSGEYLYIKRTAPPAVSYSVSCGAASLSSSNPEIIISEISGNDADYGASVQAAQGMGLSFVTGLYKTASNNGTLGASTLSIGYGNSGTGTEVKYSIYMYGGGQWVQISGNNNTGANNISANITAGGIYAIMVDNTPPAPPANVQVTPGNNAATITWDPSAGAAGYNVQRAASPFVRINSELVTATVYVDTTAVNGHSYTYAVTAVDESGNESAYNDIPVEATPKEEFLPPAAITTLKAYVLDATEGRIVLQWTATGDDGFEGGISSGAYRISCSSDIFTGSSAESYDLEIATNTFAGSTENHTITGLLRDTTYYFRLRLCDEWKNWSEASNTASTYFTIIVDTIPPALIVPPDITAEATGITTSVSIGAATVSDSPDAVITSNAPSFFSLGTTTVTWTATDTSGNTATAVQLITIVDTVQPAITINSPAGGERFIAGISTVTIAFTASDADPNPVMQSRLTNLSGTETIDVINGQAIDPGLISVGAWQLIVQATDWAGNISSSTSGAFEVMRDTTPPVTQIAVTSSDAGANFALTATDDISGVAQTVYRLDSGAWQIYMDTVTVSAATQDIDYYSTDKAGNSEAVKNYHFNVNADTVAPVTEFGVTNPADQAVFQGVTYVNGRAQFKLSAFDPEVNGISSGMKEMSYKTDSGEWVTLGEFDKTLSFEMLGDGQHSVSYKAEDNVGNVSAAGVYTAVFDKTRPAVASTYPQDGGRFNPKKHSSVKITFSEPVKCANWEDNIQITESKGRRLKGFEVRYDSNTYTALITAKFKHSTYYKVKVMNGITDLVNNTLTQYKFSFSTLISAKEGCTYEDEDTGLVIVALPGVLPCDGYFEVQLLDNVCLPRIPKPFEWLFGGRKAYLILYRNEEGEIVKEKVQKAFKLVIMLRNQWIAFAPSSTKASDGTPASQSAMDIKNMKLYHVGSVDDAVELSIHRKAAPSALADLSKGSIPKPMLVPSQAANDITQEVSAELNEFGMFTLAGFMAPSASLDDLSAYPSPFDPNSRPVTIQYYLINAANTEIAIYDIMGNLVKAWEIPAGSPGAQANLNQLLWDGRNGQGDMVANGGYIVCVSGDGKTKKFKFMVVK